MGKNSHHHRGREERRKKTVRRRHRRYSPTSGSGSSSSSSSVELSSSRSRSPLAANHQFQESAAIQQPSKPGSPVKHSRSPRYHSAAGSASPERSRSPFRSRSREKSVTPERRKERSKSPSKEHSEDPASQSKKRVARRSPEEILREREEKAARMAVRAESAKKAAEKAAKEKEAKAAKMQAQAEKAQEVARASRQKLQKSKTAYRMPLDDILGSVSEDLDYDETGIEGGTSKAVSESQVVKTSTGSTLSSTASKPAAKTTVKTTPTAPVIIRNKAATTKSSTKVTFTRASTTLTFTTAASATTKVTPSSAGNSKANVGAANKDSTASLTSLIGSMDSHLKDLVAVQKELQQSRQHELDQKERELGLYERQVLALEARERREAEEIRGRMRPQERLGNAPRNNRGHRDNRDRFRAQSQPRY